MINFAIDNLLLVSEKKKEKKERERGGGKRGIFLQFLNENAKENSFNIVAKILSQSMVLIPYRCFLWLIPTKCNLFIILSGSQAVHLFRFNVLKDE